MIILRVFCISLSFRAGLKTNSRSEFCSGPYLPERAKVPGSKHPQPHLVPLERTDRGASFPCRMALTFADCNTLKDHAQSLLELPSLFAKQLRAAVVSHLAF